MAFMNNDELLFTEKTGKLKRYKISTNTTTEITGMPAIAQNGQGGLLDVALHPDFSTNGFVYLTYCIAVNGISGNTTALGRGKLVNNQLQNFTELFRALPFFTSGNHFGSRIAFDREKFLYLSVGDRGTMENAQNTNVHAGKVMRLKDDGTVPSDNPLVGVPNTKPEIYSWGHRNIQGMAMNPANGKIYAHEHGPRGGDELNLVQKGKNYGWPKVTFGIDYNGTVISSDTAQPGLEPPLTYWVPSIAPSGLVFVQNAQNTNEADVLLGALAGTHLHWLKMKDDKVTLATRSLQGYARFRDVEQAPDGKLYALTESPSRLVLLRSNIVITSLENETETNIQNDVIFPNPSTATDAKVRLYLDRSENVTIKVLSREGQLLYTAFDQQLSSGANTISLQAENLPRGMYCVEVNKGISKSVLKWIKN
jgi:aldose sugar dehydrogenase